MNDIINYKTALYRKNNFNQPCFWEIDIYNVTTPSIRIRHGIIGKKVITEFISTKRKLEDEIQSRINAKRKTGYKYLSELKDNNSLPVKERLLPYLNTYLPEYRTTADGTMLPMLAKVYDNTNNKLFKLNKVYKAQPKINGLRCFIHAEYNQGNMFKPISLKFQSREGTFWNTLNDLEDYLLHVIEEKILMEMIENHFILDGELYLPGYSVNSINHFVKDASCKENKLLQYWFYDVGMDNADYTTRNKWMIDNFKDFGKLYFDKNNHLTNKDRFVRLSNRNIENANAALEMRDEMIDIGFEGLILRDPDAEYQYGKRNLSMIKYKKSTDGKFTIIDIYPEGIKRSNIPLLLCKNDINDSTFECHISGTFEYQEFILKNKDFFIGKQVIVEYGERSGVNQLPFHIKTVLFINN